MRRISTVIMLVLAAVVALGLPALASTVNIH